MSEKLRFICALVDEPDEAFASLCRRFGISRKTGYKWRERFEAEGLAGLKSRSRAPGQHPNATAEDVVQQVIACREDHPTWGARKIVAYLARHQPELKVPAASTVGSILKRNGLTVPRRRRHRGSRPESPLAAASEAERITMDAVVAPAGYRVPSTPKSRGITP